jgi:hypothetical protein
MSQKNVEAFEQANDRRDVEAVIEEPICIGYAIATDERQAFGLLGDRDAHRCYIRGEGGRPPESHCRVAGGRPSRTYVDYRFGALEHSSRPSRAYTRTTTHPGSLRTLYDSYLAAISRSASSRVTSRTAPLTRPGTYRSSDGGAWITSTWRGLSRLTAHLL